MDVDPSSVIPSSTFLLCELDWIGAAAAAGSPEHCTTPPLVILTTAVVGAKHDFDAFPTAQHT
jgi:hypothetical protein